MREAQSKSALTTLVDYTPAALRNTLKAVLKGQNIERITHLILLRDIEVDAITLLEEAVDADNNKIIKSTILPVTTLSAIRDLRDYAIYLMTAAVEDDITKVTEVTFNDWIFGRVEKQQTPTPTSNPSNSGLDLGRQIEMIKKADPKVLPIFNGSVDQYPGYIRIIRQICRNQGMDDILDPNFTPPANDGSLVYLLWKAQNNFLCTSLLMRTTGGQAKIFVRINVDKENGGWLILIAFRDHYESPANKAIAITNILAKLTKLVYNSRCNFSLTVHLTKFQGHIQDLADCGHTIDDVQVKSML